MFTKRFWKKATERAGKSAAQAVIGAVALDGVVNAFTLDWKLAAGVALGGALLSYLTSMATAGVGEKDSPDLVK
ncbi:holin [Glycomyces arizonensis]|uniref:holin n=1 Tax=Glycomyces arizonensis TaxID=256035 RepID=UPI0003F931BB|nr:holin [Glycomyces arizonensis]